MTYLEWKAQDWAVRATSWAGEPTVNRSQKEPEKGVVGVVGRWLEWRYTREEVVQSCIAIGLVRWLSANRCPPGLDPVETA